MKKYMLLLIILIFLVMPIYAEASFNEENPICIQIKEFDYVTAPDDIIELARLQSQKNGSRMYNEGSYVVNQMISEKTYIDGTVIREFMESNVQLKRAVDKEIKSANWNKYDIACITTAHYESHYGQGEEVGVVLINTTFSFTDTGENPIYLSKLQMHSHCIYDPAGADPIEKYLTINNPNPGSIYSLASGDKRVYGGGFQQLYCGTIVTLSDGTVSGDFDMMIVLR